LTLLPLTLIYSTQTVDSNLDGNDKAPSVPAERVITAHLMRFVLDQYGHHVLTCKKHTGAIAGHDHVMNVSAQLACNSGLRVCINCRVATTAADSNKQGDVQAMEFGISGYNDLVWDVSLVSDRIGSSTQHGLNGKLRLQLGDYLHTRARSKIRKFRRDYAAKNITFAPAILSVAGKIHPEFLRLS